MSAIVELAERLHVILVAEEEFYVRMKALLQQEGEQILALDTTGIEETVRQKELYSEEGRILEESRVIVSSTLARALELETEQPTLRTLCDALAAGVETERLANGLRTLHGRIVPLVGACQELLRENDAFAGRSLVRVQATLRTLGRLVPENPFYDERGGVEPGRSAGRLVSQAV